MTAPLIFTDSTCDLAPAELKHLNVGSLPLDVLLNGESYADWQDIDARRLFHAMNGGQQPSTAPPSVAQFREAYLPLVSSGQQVLSIHISRQLSETLKNAAQAVAELGAQQQIQLLDSAQASVALAEQVLCAATLAREGHSTADILKVLRQVRLDMQAEFCVDSLEHLHRTGRLSKAGMLLGNFFGQRPVLGFKEGKIVPLRRVRAEKAVDDLIHKLEERYGAAPLAITAVSASSSQLPQLKAALEHSALNIQRGRLQCFGAVIGANLGPGSFGFLAVPVSTLSPLHLSAL